MWFLHTMDYLYAWIKIIKYLKKRTCVILFYSVIKVESNVDNFNDVLCKDQLKYMIWCLFTNS